MEDGSTTVENKQEGIETVKNKQEDIETVKITGNQEGIETVTIKPEGSETHKNKLVGGATVEIKQEGIETVKIKQEDGETVKNKLEGGATVEIKQEGIETVKIKQEDDETVKNKLEGCATVEINQEGCQTAKFKQEKADDYEVSTIVQTQAPVVSTLGNHGNIVFSFRTSDNDSVTVVKSEPNQDEETADKNFDEESTTDKYIEAVANMLGEGTATVNSGEEAATVYLGEETATDNSGEATATNNLNQETTRNMLVEDKASYKYDVETETKMFCVETATKKVVGLPEATGAGGEEIQKSVEGENAPFTEEVQHLQGRDEKGNKVIILRPPKHKVEEMWRISNVATIRSPNEKTNKHVEHPTKIHLLKRVSSGMQLMVKSIGAATKKSEIQTVDPPEAITGAGGQIKTSQTIQEGTSCVFKEDFQKGNKVVILRYPKRKIEEMSSTGKNATNESPNKKPTMYPNRIHHVNRQSSVMQQLIEKCPPPVRVTAQSVVTDMVSHSTKDKCPETLTSSKSKPMCNILKCIFCGRKFAQIVRFKHHMKTHMERKPIVCGNCDSDFYFQSSFVEHFQKSHKLGAVYLCSECKIQFQEDELSAHLHQHKTSHKFMCGICEDGLSYLHCQVLFKHVKRHENRVPVKCGVCSKVHSNFPELESHLKEHFEEGQYMCQMCDKKCKTAVEFSEHSKSHSGLLPFECDACKMKMRNRYEVNLHRNRCPKRQIEHRCRHCLQLFKTERDLTRHYQTVHSPNTCLFCGLRFFQKVHLEAHMKTHEVVASFI